MVASSLVKVGLLEDDMVRVWSRNGVKAARNRVGAMQGAGRREGAVYAVSGDYVERSKPMQNDVTSLVRPNTRGIRSEPSGVCAGRRVQ